MLHFLNGLDGIVSCWRIVGYLLFWSLVFVVLTGRMVGNFDGCLLFWFLVFVVLGGCMMGNLDGCLLDYIYF